MPEPTVDPLAVLPAALSPSDPYARTEDTFPTLSEEHVARVAEFGRVEELAAGTVLFEVDDRGVDFFLVLQGFIEIYETPEGDDGAPQVMTVQPRTSPPESSTSSPTGRSWWAGGWGADGRVARLSRGQFAGCWPRSPTWPRS